MKYMISWNDRPQGTPLENENAQKRILEVFSRWKAPANFKIESCVIRVGDWGGYMLMECDDPLEVHKFCSMLPAFTFEARPVIPVADAIRVELEGWPTAMDSKVSKAGADIRLNAPTFVSIMAREHQVSLATVRHTPPGREECC
jgi:hypothetical protein